MSNRPAIVKEQLERRITFDSVKAMSNDVLLQNLLGAHSVATQPDTPKEDKPALREQVRILKYEAERRMTG